MGVSRMTIYRHLSETGLSSACKEFTVITDVDLDEYVVQFSLDHPFSVAEIIQSLLETSQIHLPRRRIQLSLRRVDVIGVMTR